MSEPDFPGLRAAGQRLHKLDFDDVRRRAHRRRRRQVGTGAALALTLVVAGAGMAYAVSASRDGDAIGVPPGTVTTAPFIPPAQPTPGAASGHYAQVGPLVAGDTTHLYVKYSDCQDQTCKVMMASTTDGGATWSKSALPMSTNSLGQLIALAPRTIVAWYQDSGGSGQTWLATTDGGGSWRPVTVGTAETIPEGWRALDVELGLDAQPVLAADPVTGAILRLAQPRALTMARTVAGLSPAAGLWVTGHLGRGTAAPDANGQQKVVPTGSAVEVSHDGGHSWHRQAFAEALDTGEDVLGGAAVATMDGQIAYAVGQAGGELAIYRTDDGGLTWQHTNARLHVGSSRLYAAVDAGGTLSIQLGDQAADHPTLYQSIDQGRSVFEAPIGPGAQAMPVPGGYAQSQRPAGNGIWLLPDGGDWSFVAPPALP